MLYVGSIYMFMHKERHMIRANYYRWASYSVWLMSFIVFNMEHHTHICNFIIKSCYHTAIIYSDYVNVYTV